MRVRLVRRWGSTPPGQSVDVDPTQGRWLIDHAFGVAVAEPAPAPAQAATAPAEAGSEPPASGESSGESTPPAGQPVRVRRRRKASPGS